MSLAEEIGPRLDGLEQLRAFMASGRKPGAVPLALPADRDRAPRLSEPWFC